MIQQISIAETARQGKQESRVLRRSGTNEIVPDIACKRVAIVNVVFFGPAQAPDRGWVLIDAGIPGTARLIIRAAEKRYGRESRPAAIILTHGHSDHTGALQKLANFWDVPVFAHPAEFPYLNGSASYPPPDPTVGGGLMAALSPMCPRGPVDVRSRLKELLPGEMPFMDGWKWIATPGHSPGHVSFWREADRVLIAGDAFVTTKQESAYSVAVQRPEMHGPPMFYTSDWNSARESVRKLASLEPEWVITGHGPPMGGSEMRGALKLLAADFEQVAMPKQGQCVPKAA